MPPRSPKLRSPKLRKRYALKSKGVSLQARLNVVAEQLEFQYEEEFTGVLPFAIHFLFSLFGGICFQQMFSSNPVINGKCMGDTSLSFENGVAGGSIVAYIYLSVSHDVTVPTVLYIIQNINSILIEIFKTYGVVTFAFLMQRGILIPFIFSESDPRLVITLPFFCSISGQINYITEKVWGSAENTKNDKGRNKQYRLVTYYICLIVGFVFLLINLTYAEPLEIFCDVKRNDPAASGSFPKSTAHKIPRFIIHSSPRFSTLIFGSPCKVSSKSKFSNTKKNKKQQQNANDEADDDEDFRFIPEKRKESLNILKVPVSTTSFKDIKMAFRKLALEYHPDKCIIEPKEECTKQFIKMQQAYAYLERWDNRRKEIASKLTKKL